MDDVVIVGGGIAGGALGTVLARAGVGVTILERSRVYEDRVRGEWLAPWGVREAMALGLDDDLRRAGGHHLTRHVTYDEALAPAEAEAQPLPLGAFCADVAGPLCLGHPTICRAYEAAARAAGATVRRGVERVTVTAGPEPVVTLADAGRVETLHPRLVVAADGRASSVRRQLAIPTFEDEPHHLFAGLLVDGAPDWPQDLQVIATEGDRSFLAFPQGGGRIRLYAAHPLAQRGRFGGPEGPGRFLAACDMPCCPPSESLRGAVAAGPCRTVTNADAWSERIAVPGVVLVGDAAGHNDPLIGQGLSITHRDVRAVRDVLLAGPDWSPAAFRPYAEERRERMRRLRIAAAFQASVETDFAAGASARRRRFFEALQERPELGVSLVSALGGPDVVPAEQFANAERTLGLSPAPSWPLDA